MNVLLACEFSGIVREAFRKRGHNAYSCDLIPSLDNSPYHIQGDAVEVAYDPKWKWDMMIMFTPCDRVLVAGALHWKKWQESGEQQSGIDLFMKLINSPIDKIAAENPVGILSTVYRKPDQIIDPHQFGHMEQKRTCLWLKRLRKLVPTNDVYEEMMKLPKRERERVHHESPGIKNGLTRSQRRALFFQGWADAMADQWGGENMIGIYGCQYVVSTTKKWNKLKKTFDDVPIHCSKITAEHQEMCPKHILFVEDEAKEEQRKSENRRLNREFKKRQEIALKVSPLAAINPLFDDEGKRKTGYEERFR
jgi:hypothetical protein